MPNTWESSAERLTLEPFEPHLARSRPRSRYPSEGYPPDTHFADFQKGILCFSPSVYQLVVFNLQLVSNNIATWLLTTVPGGLEQYRPPTKVRSNRTISHVALVAHNAPPVSAMP